MKFIDGESNLLVLFFDPNDSMDDAPLDFLFSEAMKIAETGGEVLWFRRSPPQRLPKMEKAPKAQHLKRIIMYYGHQQVDELLRDFGCSPAALNYPPKIYQISSILKSLFVSLIFWFFIQCGIMDKPTGRKGGTIFHPWVVPPTDG
jgi:hypothetical protein